MSVRRDDPGCELPTAYARIFDLYRTDRRDEARSLFARVLPLVVTQFQSLDYFIAASKAVPSELGVIERPDVRGASSIREPGRRLLLDHARRARTFQGVKR